MSSLVASSFVAPTTSLKAKQGKAVQRKASVFSAKAMDASLAPPTTRVPPKVPEGRERDNDIFNNTRERRK